MGILSFFARRRQARIISQTASELTQRSHEPVLERVRRRATTMRISEARGYVRSRALEIVHREMRTLHQRVPLDPTMQMAIISRATDSVVTQVLAELRSVPKAAKPAQRRAA